MALILIASLPKSSLAASQAQGEKESRLFGISKMVIAENVQNREPVGVSETFPASTEKVYCFIEVIDIKEDAEVTFVWYHEEQELETFTIPIMRGQRWRTFAYKNLYGRTGTWEVEIKDKEDNPIKSIKFTVE